MSYTVSGILHEVKKTLSNNTYREIKVVGEVSNLTESKKYTFFSLRDDYSTISCITSKDTIIEQGDKVAADGELNVYTPKGDLQIKVSSVQLKGEGAFKKQYRRTRQKLYKENILPQTPQKIPVWPQDIAVITSKEGAVIEDIQDAFRGTVSPPTLTIYDVPVQGSKSAQKITLTLKNMIKKHECVIIARGGGSTINIEGYNNLELAREISKTSMPIITSIGHKKDLTIADLVSDKAVSTPTKAGMILAKQKEHVQKNIETIYINTYERTKKRMKEQKQSVEHEEKQAQSSLKNRLWSLKDKLVNSQKVLSKHPLSALQTKNACLIYKDKQPLPLQKASGKITLVSTDTEKKVVL